MCGTMTAHTLDSLFSLPAFRPCFYSTTELRTPLEVASDHATDHTGGICHITVRRPGDELIGPDQDQRRLVELPAFRAVVPDQLERHAASLGGAADFVDSEVRRTEIEQCKAGAQFLEDIAARCELARREMMAGARCEFMRSDR